MNIYLIYLNRKLKKIIRYLYDYFFILLSKLPFQVTLIIKSKKCGFFGDLAQTLNAIRFCEMNALNCKVHWDENSLSFDVNFGRNVWGYYFNKSEFHFY